MAWARQLHKLHQAGASTTQLANLWHHRVNAKFGPMACASHALSLLGIKWSHLGSLAFGPHHCNLFAQQLRLHDLRALLRAALWAGEASRRPKDFAGLEHGAYDDHALYDTARVPFGPSLHCAGVWTRLRLFAARLAANPLCLRCGTEAESVMHRMWYCPANKEAIATLDAQLTHPMFDAGILNAIDILPACVARCGIFPRGSPVPCTHRQLIVDYLLHASRCGSTALAVHHHCLKGGVMQDALLPNLSELDGKAIDIIRSSLGDG